jgi:hypothetical protein
MPYPDESRPSLFGIDAVNSKGYEYPLKDEDGIAITQSLTNSTSSTPWIITPRGVQNIVVIIEITGTVSCRVDVTCSRSDEILAGTAFALAAAVATAASIRYELKPCSAVRMTQISGTGTCKLHYRAQ